MISLLFCARFEVIFLSSSARGLEWFRSSFAWVSKIILIQWYFYPLPLEVRSWSWFTDTSILLRSRFEANLEMVIFSFDWTYIGLPILFCSSLALGCALVLPRISCRPVKLGSQNMSTYMDLPLIASLIALWLCRACLLDWTYTFDANLVRIWNSLKTLIYLNYLFSPHKSF